MKKWMVYTLYITVVTLIFLYYLFPTDAVTAYINYRISKSIPGVRVSAAEIRPSLPFALRFSTLVLFDNDRAVIRVDRLKITPAISKILSAEKSFSFTGDACGGYLKGSARFSAPGEKQGLGINLTFGDLQINRIQGLHDTIPAKLAGVAKGRVLFNGNPPPFGKGNADLTLSDCSLAFTPSLWGIKNLAFNSIDARFELVGQRIRLKQFEVKSDQLSGKAGGALSLAVPANKSRLDISGHIMPRPEFIKQLGGLFPVELFSAKKNRNRGIPFKITGTIEHPNFNLK